MPEMSDQQFQNQDSDLYAQIASADEEMEQARPKSSLIMSFMIMYMRWTLAIDAKRRQYTKFFHFLGITWALGMILIYLCGLTMFGILVYSYSQLHTYIEAYLKENDVLFEKIEIPGYILSRVDLYGLHDKENTYYIEKTSISSTFSDFLNRRAKSVSATGVKLNLDTVNISDQPLIKTLQNVNKMTKNGHGIRIDSLDVSDAVFNLKGKEFTLPIALSLTGVYGQETNISAPLTVNSDNLQIKGHLLVKNEARGIHWELSIQEGNVLLPNRPKEAIQGKITLNTEMFDVKEATADITLLYERLRKSFNLSLAKGKNNFDGKLDVKWIDLTNADKPDERTTLALGFKDLMLSPTGDLKTTELIDLALNTHYSTDFKIDSLNTTLSGELSCQEFKKCSYSLKEPSILMIQQMTLPVMSGHIQNKKKFQITINPNEKLLDANLQEGKLDFDFDFQKWGIEGTYLETANPIDMEVEGGRFFGVLNLWNKKVTAALDIHDLQYQSDTVKIESAILKMDDVFATTGNMYLKTPYMYIPNNDKLKVPFAVEYTRKNNISDIILNLEGNRAQILFGGSFDPLTAKVDGQMVIPPVDLSKLRQPLSNITGLIPEEIQSLSGTVSAYGRLSGSLNANLKGPFYLALSNVGMVTKNFKLKELNTVLLIQSTSPLTTEADQKISIGSITSFAPFSNIRLALKLDERFAQIKNLSAFLFNVPLYAEETLLPYQNVGTLIYLRNKNDNLSDATNFLTLKDWKVATPINGNILFPLEVRDMTFNLKNAVLKLTDLKATYQGKADKKPAFLEGGKEILVKSGNITIDTNPLQPDLVKMSAVLEAILDPTDEKQTIRESFSGKISDIATIKEIKSAPLDSEIKSQVKYVQERAESYRVK